ncbi:unnamed protein product [marine sediment metagenome]|uniref:NAD-dependent epimerase/dehydratase domain-containing protein n=1 Tax=marine sediment metagenome TaxID=412755 RepID=X0TU84_9ZZZZ
MDKKYGDHLNINKLINFPNMNLEKVSEEKTDIDMIIHCAAFCRIRECIKDPDQTIMDNVIGTYNVFEYARRQKIKKVILFSSSRVEYLEKNIYTASKKFMENLAVAYQECYGIDYIIIRPSTVYGAMDFSDRLFPRFINNAFRNEDLIVYGTELKTLSIMHVIDVIPIVAKCVNYFVRYMNQTFNIATETRTVTYIAAQIIKIIGSKSKITYELPELSQPQNVNQEHNFDDYKPQIELEEGIRKTIGG